MCSNRYIPAKMYRFVKKRIALSQHPGVCVCVGGGGGGGGGNTLSSGPHRNQSACAMSLKQARQVASYARGLSREVSK